MPAESTASEYLQALARQTAAQELAADAYGSARWLPEAEYEGAELYEGEIRCGRSASGDVLRYNRDGHCLTFGPNGSGKSVSVVVPAALTWPGSLVLIDPKGAICPMTLRHRVAKRHKVWLLDPFNEVKGYAFDQYRRSFNPLSFLDPESDLLIDDVRLIASSLIISESDKNRFFSDSARTILEAIILYVLTMEPESWTMENVVDYAFSSPEKMAKIVIPAMQKSENFHGLLKQLGNQIEGFIGEAGANIFSSLRRSLNFLQSPLMKAALKPSDVDFKRLKDENITVYLVLPAMRLDAYGRWLRVMLSIILNSILDPRQPDHPVLFLLDEAAALQRLEMIETGIALFRGYSIKLWLIFQDLAQLKRTYPDSWSTFIANAGMRQFFNVNDLETAQYVSQFLGNETREIASKSLDPNAMPGGNLMSMQRPLMTPDEVLKLPGDMEILLYDRVSPVLAKKLVYWREETDPEFIGLYDPDPYRKGK